MIETKTPTADQSAAILADHLRRREPFFFIRYGDGATECIFDPKKHRHTCDGEFYTEDLGKMLLLTWRKLANGRETVFAGDWQSASFGGKTGNNRELERWHALTSNVPFRWLHFEALLLMRESTELVNFYRAVREDRRRKVYMGPQRNAGAARFLGAFHLVTPMIPDLIHRRLNMVASLEAFSPEIVLYGAGLAGNVIAVDHWERHPDHTCISLGSALDPLFGPRTRTQQLPPQVLKRMFRGML